jgi:hypothetical protein
VLKKGEKVKLGGLWRVNSVVLKATVDRIVTRKVKMERERERNGIERWEKDGKNE